MTDVMADAGQEQEPGGLSAADEQLLRELTERARADGLQLTGEGGLLQQLTKTDVWSRPWRVSWTDHLGYDRHDPAGQERRQLPQRQPLQDGADRGRARGDQPCRVTGIGSFEPKIVKKRQRRLTGVDDMVISLVREGPDDRGDRGASGRGLRRRRLQADDLHDHRQGPGRHGRMAEPAPRPGLSGRLHRRDPREDPRRCGRQPAGLRGPGRHRGRPPRHPGPVGRGRRRGRQALAARPDRDQEPRRGRCPHARLRRPQGPARRGRDRLAEATIVQTCVVHLLRNSFRYAARQDWDKIAKDLKPVYTAATEDAALERFAEFADTWGKSYPAIVRLWENAWEEFIPFLRFDTEIRTDRLHDQRDRVRQRSDPPGGQGPRSLPQRAGRTEVRLHGDHVAWTPPARDKPAGPAAGRPLSTPSTSPSTADSAQHASNHRDRSYTVNLTDPRGVVAVA